MRSSRPYRHWEQTHCALAAGSATINLPRSVYESKKKKTSSKPSRNARSRITCLRNKTKSTKQHGKLLPSNRAQTVTPTLGLVVPHPQQTNESGLLRKL
jgi:hypothetical protein